MLRKIPLSKDIKKIQISCKGIKLICSFYSIKIYTQITSWEQRERNTQWFEIISITVVKILKTPAALLVHDYDDMH
jgi:hypothetical protein